MIDGTVPITTHLIFVSGCFNNALTASRKNVQGAVPHPVYLHIGWSSNLNSF